MTGTVGNVQYLTGIRKSNPEQTMFTGHKVVGYCSITLIIVTNPFRP